MIRHGVITVSSKYLNAKVDLSSTENNHFQLPHLAQLKRYAYISCDLAFAPVENLQLVQVLGAESFYIYIMKYDCSNVQHLLQHGTLQGLFAAYER